MHGKIVGSKEAIQLGGDLVASKIEEEVVEALAKTVSVGESVSLSIVFLSGNIGS